MALFTWFNANAFAYLKRWFWILWLVFQVQYFFRSHAFHLYQRQGFKNCGILQSSIGDYWESLEDMEKRKTSTRLFIYDSKSCIRDSKHSTRLLKTLFFIAFIATVEKSCTLDPGSGLDWRTLSDLRRPDQRYNNLCSIGGWLFSLKS